MNPYDPSKHYAIRPTADPFAEPVDLQEAKDHCRIDGSEEDSLISGWITAARNYAERETSRKIVTTGLKLTLDGFPRRGSSGWWLAFERYRRSWNEITIPVCTIQSVASIIYVDASAASQTLAAGGYRLDTESEPHRITPAFGSVWPATLRETGAVTIAMTAGTITPFTAVASTDICTAKGRNYATGDILRIFNSGGALPSGLACLTDYYVVNASGSTFKLSLTLGGSAIDIIDAGQGTHFASNPSSGLSEIEGLRAAIKLMVGHWYENRETSTDGNLKDIPLGVEALLWQRRVFV